MQRSDQHSDTRLTPVFSDRNIPPHFRLFSRHDIHVHDIDSAIVKTPLSNLDQQEIQSGYPVETTAEETNSSEEHKKMPPEASEYQFTTPHLTASQELDSNTTTQRSSDPTTDYEEDIQTTLVDVEDSYVSTQSIRQDRSTKPSISKYWLKTDTEPPTSSATESEEQPLQVISVRVSSSVVRQKPRKLGSDHKPQTRSEQPVIAKDEEEDIVGTLHIQEEPKITAVQRSQFAVEEESSPEEKSYLGSANHKAPAGVYGYRSPAEVEAVVEEVRKVHHTENRKSKNHDLPERLDAYHNPPQALRSHQQSESHTRQADNKTSGADPVETLAYQDGSYVDPQSAPVSYHTSVSTATSGSQVRFYSEPPSYKRRGVGSVAETVHTPVVLDKTKLNSQGEGQTTHFGVKEPNTNQRIGDAQYTEKPQEHQEQAEKNYEVPEEVYGTPEENYEIDESVSVMTNGRAHGVQAQTPPQPTQGTPPQQQTEDDQKSQEPNHKFGYVVEGRNFRKYRVEERTPDGFIVGEYGVVSHDDGSLRGVRYTADSNINPRLIYDTLVKFLSLK